MAYQSPHSEHYLQQLETAILHAATTGSQESSHRLDVERCQSVDGLACACLELLRRRGWGGGGGGGGGGSAIHGNGQQQQQQQQQGEQGSPKSSLAVGVAQHDAVAFYALTTLQRSPLLSCLPAAPTTNDFSALRGQLRHILLTTMSHLPNLLSMPSFVATKVGVLLALLVREEYPTDWACPLRDVLAALGLSSPNNGNDNGNDINTLNKIASMGMYLSFLDAISDEIVYPAAFDYTEGKSPHNNQTEQQMRREQVKDALRGYAINGSKHDSNNSPLEPCVPLEHTHAAHIVGWLLNVLSTVQSQNVTNENEEVWAIAVRAVATMKRYLSWIDLRLATNQNLVHMLLVGLGGASPGSDNEEEPTQRTLLAVECAHSLSDLAGRGMDEQKKSALLAELNIFGTLCCLSQLEVGNGAALGGRLNLGSLDLITADGTQIEAVAAAAELINTAGLELIQGWELDPTLQSTNTQMKQCLELMLACLAYDSIDVSGAVVDIISRVLVSLEKKEEYWNSGGLFNHESSNGNTFSDAIISRILLILHLRMKYPADFGFDYEDEEEAEEEFYRGHLRKLYQRIVRLRPQIALQFVGQCLASLPQPLSSSPTPDVEVALRFVYHYGEGRRPAPGAKTALKDAPFREIVMALHRSDVSSHPHREILLLYYDLGVRYSALLKDSPELLTLLLGSLSGNRGLQHPHTRVRCRCCYLLLRLIKLVGAKAMRAHVEVVVDGIQSLLFPVRDTLSIPPNEALYLFEATGILLGTTGLDTALQVRCVTAVLTPHIRSIEQTLQSPDLTRDVETFGEQFSMSISAIAQLSKGWQKHPPPEVQTVFAAAVDICRNVLVALPSSPLVRNRTAVLLQRMILCLGEGILPAMPSFLDALLSHCTLEDDVLDSSQLINQICIKFKEKAAASIDSAILPFLQRVLAIQLTETTVSPGSNDTNSGNHGIYHPPHLITEQLSIRKQAFSTLQHIAVHNVSAVLYSDKNLASLGDILQLMNDGTTPCHTPDPVVNKTCAQFFCELINQWGCCSDHQILAPPTHVSNAFFEFVYGVFVPGMIGCILDTTFNSKDALHCRVLSEFSRALAFLKQSSRGTTEFKSRVVELLVLGGNTGVRKGSLDIAAGFQNAMRGKDMEVALKAWKEELKQQ
ncbi:hypothetical protein ACHAXR_008708 [Thalassiosira sp. AJA248-18]